jgi:hypothetical protein
MEIHSVRASARKERKYVAEAGENAGGGRDGTDECDPKGNPGGGHTRAVRSVREVASSKDVTGVA